MNGIEALSYMYAGTLIRNWDRSDIADWASVLSTFALFSGVGKRRLRRLVRSATFTELPAGSRILEPRDGRGSLNIILGGAARPLRDAAARELRVGDYFGELALFDETRRATTVIATRQLHLMRLPREAVLELARQEPTVTLSLLQSLGARIRRFEPKVA